MPRASVLRTAAVLSLTPFVLAAQAPADYGPVSANVAEIAYPHPVSTLAFVFYGKDVQMAYMDVKPTGTPNGQTVVLLHGFNFFGEAWRGTIDVLTREGFRVIVPDQIGFGRSSKPLVPYTFNDMALNTRRGPLADVGMRRRVARAVDVTAAVRRALGRFVRPANGVILPGLVGYSVLLCTYLGYSYGLVAQRDWRAPSLVLMMSSWIASA